jgi:site-specific recombinase XerD
MPKLRRSYDSNTRLMKPGFLGPSLAEFLNYLSQLGYSRLSIEGYAMSVAHFAVWAKPQPLTLLTIDEKTLRRFAGHRCKCPGGRHHHSVSPKYVARVRRFVSYLRCGKLVRRSTLTTLARGNWQLAETFADWLRDHRGVGSVTIRHHIEQLEKMPQWLLHAHKSRLRAANIRSLIVNRAPKNSDSARRWMTTALRMYLRFLGSTGRCALGLENAVPPIPQWRLAALPRYLPADKVEQLVAICDTAAAHGARDRAILLLLARLGLRAGDVANLRLDDFDWRSGRIKVCGKARRETWLPLPQDAGDAVLAYLKKRPPIALDSVFLCTNAPYRSITSHIVSDAVGRALQRAGIEDAPSRGASLLRHSAATSMLRAGATLDAVSAMLRHRSLDMTMYYAKVDLPMLERIAQPWPTSASC